MDNIESYFFGERNQCIIGIIGATLFIFASIYSLYLQKPFYKGLAFTTIPLCLLLVSICIGVVARTNIDINRVRTYASSQPEKLKTQELTRMEKVMKNFSIVKKVELGLFLIGVVLLIFLRKSDLASGIALALIINGALLYLFDHIAESRGEAYIQFLRNLVN